MTTPETKESGKVSLEELLRLKRAERPGPEFWARFEQDLRTKQLAAIVAKRPWWVSLRLPQASRALARWQVQLPLGAAAALMVSLALVGERGRDDAPVAVRLPAHAWVNGLESAMAAASTPTPTPEGGLHVAALDASPSLTVGAVATPPEDLAQPASVVAEITPEAGRAPATEVEVGSLPLPGKPLAVADLAEGVLHAAEEPGELPAVVFADVVNVESAARFDEGFALDLFGLSARLAEVRAVGGRSGSTPASARDGRRERLRASLVVAAHGAERDQVPSGPRRDVLASALDDGRGYDGAGRIGMGGDRLTLKF